MVKDTERLPHENGLPEDLMVGILKAINPEKIICFGMRSKRIEAWSCFLPDKEAKTLTAYDIIILTKPNDQRPRHELLDMVDSLNSENVKVNALIHNVIGVKEAVHSGNPFFSRVCAEGKLLYDNQNISLNLPLKKYNHMTTVKINELWVKYFGLAQNFLAGASHFLIHRCNDLSAFMLHQAVEHTCIALTRVITGYRPNTHNLGRLITITENFAPFYPTEFPRNTKEETHLFQILSKAYSDARYNESYNVTNGEIAILMDRVSAFQRSAETLYHKKIMNKTGFLQTAKD